jgi:FAD binding domain
MQQPSTRGTTIRRGEPEFDSAVLRTSFSANDTGLRPHVLVQANDVADVVAAIRCATRDDLRVSVRSGGHSWNQNHLRDGGLLLDMSRLNSIEVWPEEKRAVVGAAVHGGDLDGALVPHRLFFPVAHAYTVGLAGFLLTGGFGWGCRIFGMACESVVGIDVVLADGSLVHASETEHADLLWAARGGGPGFFGVITAFHLRLHPRPRFTGVKIQIFHIDHLEEVFRWATEVGPQVSHKVEFQMVMNRKAAIIGKQGIEVLSPVFADSYAEARRFVYRQKCAASEGERHIATDPSQDRHCHARGGENHIPAGRPLGDRQHVDRRAHRAYPAPSAPRRRNSAITARTRALDELESAHARPDRHGFLSRGPLLPRALRRNSGLDGLSHG